MSSRNIVDLVISNRPDIISNGSVVPGINDHDIVLFTVKSACQRKRNVKRKLLSSKDIMTVNQWKRSGTTLITSSVT